MVVKYIKRLCTVHMISSLVLSEEAKVWVASISSDLPSPFVFSLPNDQFQQQVLSGHAILFYSILFYFIIFYYTYKYSLAIHVHMSTSSNKK